MIFILSSLANPAAELRGMRSLSTFKTFQSERLICTEPLSDIDTQHFDHLNFEFVSNFELRAFVEYVTVLIKQTTKFPLVRGLRGRSLIP